jgi:hypothetical protein
MLRVGHGGALSIGNRRGSMNMIGRDMHVSKTSDRAVVDNERCSNT